MKTTNTQTEIKKYNVEFLDANNNKVVCNIEFKQNDKGLCFSMSGEYANSCGQCFDSVKPKGTAQNRLIKIWKDYHLNDMNAGTEEQEKALKPYNNLDYDKQVSILKGLDLYEVTLKDGSLYKYGSAWLYRELPLNLEQEVKDLIKTIESEEEERKEQELKPEEIKELNELLEDDRIKALKSTLDLDDRTILNITSRKDIYTVDGFEYYVLTEEEAEEKARDYLDRDLWIDAIKHDRTTESFTDWQDEIIKCDGYGHLLNSWDGSEDDATINGVLYYVIRC